MAYVPLSWASTLPGRESGEIIEPNKIRESLDCSARPFSFFLSLCPFVFGFNFIFPCRFFCHSNCIHHQSTSYIQSLVQDCINQYIHTIYIIILPFLRQYQNTAITWSSTTSTWVNIGQLLTRIQNKPPVGSVNLVNSFTTAHPCWLCWLSPSLPFLNVISLSAEHGQEIASSVLATTGTISQRVSF